MDLGLGADIDAARRLVHDQHLGLGRHPFGQHDLLLIAAGELPDDLLRPAGADAEAGDRIPRQSVLLAAIDQEQAGDAVEDRQGDVLAQRLRPDQPLQPAILRHIGDAQAPRRRGAADRDRLALDQDLARCRRGDAEDGEGELGPARADQPGDAEDLAGAQGQIDIADRLAAAEAAQLESDLARHRLGLREELIDGAAHHHRDQIGFADLADRLGGDMGAVAQHRHPVGQREDLRQLVGDIGDADAALAQAPDHLQQPARIRIRQCGRRLVHDDQLGVLRQGLGDLDPLAVRHREAADDGIDVEIMAVEGIEQGASAGPHGGPVHAAPAGARRMADIDVLRHAQLGEQQQFLIDRGDALGRRLAGRGKPAPACPRPASRRHRPSAPRR